jgi:hypothetical protein
LATDKSKESGLLLAAMIKSLTEALIGNAGLALRTSGASPISAIGVKSFNFVINLFI